MHRYLFQILLLSLIIAALACGKKDSAAAAREAVMLSPDLAGLLQSTAWCSWEYQQIGQPDTGVPVSMVEKSRRAVFNDNGTAVLTTLTKRSGSGSDGDYYGETPDREDLRWNAKESSLSIAFDGSSWKTLPVTIRDQYLVIDGKEWQACN